LTEPLGDTGGEPRAGGESDHPVDTSGQRTWSPDTRTLLGISLALALALGLARAFAGLPWLIVILIAVACLGVVLWLPRSGDVDSRASAGAALTTSAIISAMFFALTVRDEHNQNRLAARAEVKQQAIADAEARELQLTLQHNLAGVSLKGQNLGNFELANKDLAGADLYKVQIPGGRLRGTDLNGADLARANLRGTGLFGASVIGASLAGADLDSANLDQATLAGADIGTSFVEQQGRPTRAASLVGANLEDADLRGACLAGANLHDASFEGTDLRNADLDYTNLTGARFLVDGLGPAVQGATFYGARLDSNARSLLADDHVSLSGPRKPPPQPPVPVGAISSRVDGHSDGDTFELARLGWVRLIGMNAPDDLLPATAAATHRINQLLPIGASARYTLGRPRREPKPDGTGRALVYVWTASGIFVNSDLLARGDAIRETDQRQKSSYTKVFDTAQNYARASGLGVWAYCPDYSGNDLVIPK